MSENIDHKESRKFPTKKETYESEKLAHEAGEAQDRVVGIQKKISKGESAQQGVDSDIIVMRRKSLSESRREIVKKAELEVADAPRQLSDKELLKLRNICTAESAGNHLELTRLLLLLKLNSLPLANDTSCITAVQSTDLNKILRVIDRFSQEVLLQKDWPVQKLNSEAISKIPGGVKHVEMVVHPLYTILHTPDLDEDLWDSVDGDIESYIEKKVISAAGTTLNVLQKDPNAVPSSYMFLMEIAQELKSLRTPSKSQSMRIFVMPRHSLLQEKQQVAMSALLSRYSGKSDAVIDSKYNYDGDLDEVAMKTLRDVLPNGIEVEMQGGYLRACLKTCLQSMKKIGRDDLKYSVDFDGSSALYTDSNENLVGDEWGDFADMDLPKIKKPNKELQSSQDVLDWVLKDNSEFNEAYKQGAMKKYKSFLNQRGIDKGVRVSHTESSDTDSVV